MLVTRAELDGRATGQRLIGQGHQPILLPLSKTVPLSADASGLRDISLVAVTSANAVRHASPKLINALRFRPWFAVGRKTADAIRAFGVEDVRNVDGDAATLAHALLRDVPAGDIAYLCGRVRLSDFEAMLRVAGRTVHVIETYDTVEVAYDDGQLDRYLGSEPLDAALVYSARSAEGLSRLVARSMGTDRFADTRFICISTRVAATLDQIPAEQILVSVSPNEAGMLAMLDCKLG